MKRSEKHSINAKLYLILGVASFILTQVGHHLVVTSLAAGFTVAFGLISLYLFIESIREEAIETKEESNRQWTKLIQGGKGK